MSKKIYPGIYRDTGGNLFLDFNQEKYYDLVNKEWKNIAPEDDCTGDTNITREYLANTYGMVESVEHADFIANLAKSNGIKVGNCYSFDGWFCFHSNCLWFYSDEIVVASDCKEKQIHLPLPPKESQPPKFNASTPMPECKTPKEAEEKVTMPELDDMSMESDDDFPESHLKKPDVTATEIAKYFAYAHSKYHSYLPQTVRQAKSDFNPHSWVVEAISYAMHITNQKDEINNGEWPQVGDWVFLDLKLMGVKSKLNESECEVMGVCKDSIGRKVVVLERFGLIDCFVMGDWIKKPPTPLELLQKSIKSKLEDVDIEFKRKVDKSQSEIDFASEYFAKAIINGEINNLKYEPSND